MGLQMSQIFPAQIWCLQVSVGAFGVYKWHCFHISYALAQL